MLAVHTHSDLCIRSPVWRCHLVSNPGSDGFGGASTVLNHIVHPIQDPLGSILVAGQKSVRLKKDKSMISIKSLIKRMMGKLSAH